MEKEVFLREYKSVSVGYEADEEFAWQVYEERVLPYELLITKFRNGEKDKRLSMEQIRRGLGVSQSMWKRFKSMPTFQEIIDADGDLMRMKAQMDIVKGVSQNPKNAKLLELQAKRFDPFYMEEGKDVDTPTKIEFKIVDTGMSEEEIKKETGIKLDDEGD